jgi:hypothetical protein
MNRDSDITWVTDLLPDVPEPDPEVTERAYLQLMEHLADAAPAPSPSRRRQPRRPRVRRPRRLLQLGLVAAGAAAVAVVAVDVGTSGGGSVAEAQAAQLLAHARTSLAAGPGRVLEYTMTRGSRVTFQAAEDGARPQDWVEIWSLDGKPKLIRGQEGHRQELYDPANHTIYRDAATTRGLALAPEDENELAELKSIGTHPTVDRHATFNGRAAVLVTLHFTGGTVDKLWVDPAHGDRPLRLREAGAPRHTHVSSAPQIAVATATWKDYRTVTLTKGSPSPARLSQRFPSATIKTLSPKRFAHREGRYLGL